MSADEKQLLLTLIDEVKSLKRKLELTNKPSYTNEDVLKIFGISRPTLQKWRNEGLLGYSQIGSTYCYSPKDIENFLSSHHNDAYAITA